MGRTAENEMIKLRATYLNNVSVGLTVAGVLIPFLAIIPRLSYIVGLWETSTLPSHLDVMTAIGTGLAVVLALQGAKSLRRAADQTIRRLRDDDELEAVSGVTNQGG